MRERGRRTTNEGNVDDRIVTSLDKTLNDIIVWFFTIYFRSKITINNWSTLKPKLFDCRGVYHHISLELNTFNKSYKVIR